MMSWKTLAKEGGATCPGKIPNSHELRIVLIGGRELNGDSSNKSATGNIILGESVFDTSKRTAQSVMRRRDVHGRQVTVVDTPGWWWHYPQENTPELDKIAIENSVHLCHPGPHAFLLIIPLGLVFPQIFIPSLKEHLQLFGKDIFKHTIVVFTVDGHLGLSLEHEIYMWPALQWTLEQCDNRKHVLNVSGGQNRDQVKTLLNKIELMNAENGSHFSVDCAAGEALSKKIHTMSERALKRFAEVQSQRKRIRALIEGGISSPAHLRLVMVGAQGSAKSSAGNTILRKDAFSVSSSRTTQTCEMRHSLTADRHLTVIDSPGWFYNHTLQETCEMDKLEIRHSMSLCPLGAHAVLLVVGLASAVNSSYQRAVREHMNLFSEGVWAHTIILFTRGDWLGARTIEERIESEEALQWLVEKCGNRYHVLDNTSSSDDRQVTELLDKIEEMMVGNKNTCYEVSLDMAEQMEAQKDAADRTVKRIWRMAQTQSRVLRELFKGEMWSLSDMRIVLIGKKESGKSMAGNRILFEEMFGTAWMKKEFKEHAKSMAAVQCQQKNVGGLSITVVEALGYFTTTNTPDRLKGEILRSISLCDPGPHAFLLVVSISKSFTDTDLKAMLEHLTPFGERVWRHCMVLFTWEDWLSSRPVEDYIAREGKALCWLVKKCEYKYHSLNCNRFGEAHPVIELFQKITNIVTRNKGHFVTSVDKETKPKTQGLATHAKKSVLTEEEWSRREQELIDRVLKALAQEPEEPLPPRVRMVASIDGAFIPSLSGHVPSDFGSTQWNQNARTKVSEWLSRNTGVGNSAITSGISSMNSSASYMERMDLSPEEDDIQQSTKTFLTENEKIFNTVIQHGMLIQRRYSH